MDKNYDNKKNLVFALWKSTGSISKKVSLFFELLTPLGY